MKVLVVKAKTGLDSEVVANHPELHHYTTLAGLTGIVQSNTLWATHFSQLNDSNETRSASDCLRPYLLRQVQDFINAHMKLSSKLRRSIERHGSADLFATYVADGLLDVLYKVSFVGRHSSSLTSGLNPFIVSFCSHARDNAYEREHGLLSQWRGYGGTGGYCLVFDTSRLRELLLAEAVLYFWSRVAFQEVAYVVDDFDVHAYFSNLAKLCEQMIQLAVSGKRTGLPGTLDPVLIDFSFRACLLKHRGFQEEREVRIIASPTDPRAVEMAYGSNPKVIIITDKKIAVLQKPIHVRQVNGGDWKYIALFEDFSGAPLPIRRVIVGPSRDQAANVARARAILGAGVTISVSATPYIGN